MLFCNDDVLDLVARIKQLGGYAQLPGGKIGAYVMVYASPQKHEQIRKLLLGFQEAPFRFSREGTKIVQTQRAVG